MVPRFQSDNMSNTSSIDAMLTQATEKEREYNWLGAAETYAKALDLMPAQDFLGLGDLHERLGYAFRKAAMQAEDVNAFKSRMDKAIAYYDKAHEAYAQIVNSETANAKVLRCNAANAYAEHWLASDSSEKKKRLDDCWKLVTDSMRAFEQAEEHSEFAKTYLQLSDAAIFLFTREPYFKSREKIIQEALDSGEKTIESSRRLKMDSHWHRLAREPLFFLESSATTFEIPARERNIDRKASTIGPRPNSFLKKQR